MARWDMTHDPDARPLGCNGKYGSSGVKVHGRRGTKACSLCRAAANHYWREKRRGQPTPRRLMPCGTRAAFRRHERRGEKPCFKCRVAEAEYKSARKKVMDVHQ